MLSSVFRIFYNEVPTAPRLEIPPWYPATKAVEESALPALKLLTEICACWNEALEEARGLPPFKSDEEFAIRFRDKMNERAVVPMQKIFDKVHKDFEKLEAEKAAFDKKALETPPRKRSDSYYVRWLMVLFVMIIIVILLVVKFNT